MFFYFFCFQLVIAASGIAIDTKKSKEIDEITMLEGLHIIDWHVHVAGLGYGNSGNFINDEMHKNFRFGFIMDWLDVSENELENFGDQIVVNKLNDKIVKSRYIDQAIVLALDGVIDEKTGLLDKKNTQVYVANDFVATETARYPSLLFGASINPHRRNSIELLEKVFQQGAVLVKWIPSIMGIDPADEELEPFYRKMVELDIPLLTHTGMEKTFANANDELADPLRLEFPLKCGVIVIAAHIATTGKSEGQGNFERILPLFNKYPNLYTDISSLTQVNKLGYLARALKQPGLVDRMLYGSDWPLQSFPLVSPWYHIPRIGIKKAWQISRIINKWDRDVNIKLAYGVPLSVFKRRVGLLNHHRPEH